MIIKRHFAAVASLQQPAAMAPGRGMQCGGGQRCGKGTGRPTFPLLVEAVRCRFKGTSPLSQMDHPSRAAIGVRYPVTISHRGRERAGVFDLACYTEIIALVQQGLIAAQS